MVLMIPVTDSLSSKEAQINMKLGYREKASEVEALAMRVEHGC